MVGGGRAGLEPRSSDCISYVIHSICFLTSPEQNLKRLIQSEILKRDREKEKHLELDFSDAALSVPVNSLTTILAARANEYVCVLGVR